MAGPRWELTDIEERLVDQVGRGEALDLTGDTDTVTEAEMRSWGPDRTVRAGVLRDIVLGHLTPDPDPHGLQLRGARIDGRLDLENITASVAVELTDCLLDHGLNARDAHLPGLALMGCRLEHPTEPPLDAARFTAVGSISLHTTTITGHSTVGAVRLTGARIGGQLNCSGAALRNDSGAALSADGMQVADLVVLQDVQAVGAGETGAVRLVGVRIGGQLACRGAVLGNQSGPALSADGMQVDQGVFLQVGFQAVGAGKAGAVRLNGARIGGQLECDGAVLRNDSGPALSAYRLQVGAVFLRNGFQAVGAGKAGAVRLNGARIGGQLDCSGAALRNDSGPALTADRLQVDDDVILRAGFTAIGAGLSNVVLDLQGARIGGIQFVPGGCRHTQDPRRRLNLDGLTYVVLPRVDVAEGWLGLIRQATPAYAAQPYQQLAAAHRAAGHDSEARRVLIQQRRDQLDRGALTGRAEQFWARVTGVTLGFGYQPWRALLFLAAVVATSIALAVLVGGHGGGLATRPAAAAGQAGGGPAAAIPVTAATVPCSAVDQVGVGLDLGLPLVKVATRDRCQPTGTTAGEVLTVGSWVLQALAWTFATLFIAGFTNAVRKT